MGRCVPAKEVGGTGYPWYRRLGSLAVGSKICKVRSRPRWERVAQPKGAGAILYKWT
jgi:hypothetical protein